MQSAALLQILLTYITAFLFYRDAAGGEDSINEAVEHSDVMGVILVCINSACFLAMTVGTVVGIRISQRNHAEGQLRVQLRGENSKSGGRKKKKEMLIFAKHLIGEAEEENEDSLKFHTFLSHVWSSAQDQMRFLKTRLLTLVPNARVFLDVVSSCRDRISDCPCPRSRADAYLD